MLNELGHTFLSTIRDVAPIVVLIAVFQVFIIKKPIPHLKTIAYGVVLVVFGLAFFLIGLDTALFPLGEVMAQQLSSPEFVLKH